MKIIKVKIEGVKPILLNNPASMGAGLTNARGANVIPSPQAEADGKLYWTDDRSSIAFPSIAVMRCILGVSSLYKDPQNKKMSITPLLAGSVEIDPLMIPFNTLEYSVFTCRAVIQGKGIMRSRPKLFPWALNFNLLVNEEDLGTQVFAMLRKVLEEGGRRSGLGDFRIQKKGPFGKFVVTEWVEVEEQILATAAD